MNAMRIGWLGATVVAGILSTGCAAGAAKFNPAKAVVPESMGAHVDATAGTVLFYYRPDMVTTVSKHEQGQSAMDQIHVTSVTLAGPFNGWDMGSWPLVESDGTWTLTKPVAEVGTAGEVVPFKFVVNSDLWVEPPATAMNKIDAGVGNNSENWTVTLP